MPNLGISVYAVAEIYAETRIIDKTFAPSLKFDTHNKKQQCNKTYFYIIKLYINSRLFFTVIIRRAISQYFNK